MLKYFKVPILKYFFFQILITDATKEYCVKRLEVKVAEEELEKLASHGMAQSG